MTIKECAKALGYYAHASAIKEVDFFHMELIEQVQAGQISVFTFATISKLNKMWLSPLAVIPQRNRRPRMIHDFTWSGSMPRLIGYHCKSLYALETPSSSLSGASSRTTPPSAQSTSARYNSLIHTCVYGYAWRLSPTSCYSPQMITRPKTNSSGYTSPSPWGIPEAPPSSAPQQRRPQTWPMLTSCGNKPSRPTPLI